MIVEEIIHELIVAKAQVAHHRGELFATPWDDLTEDQREECMSVARRSVEPLLLVSGTVADQARDQLGRFLPSRAES